MVPPPFPSMLTDTNLKNLLKSEKDREGIFGLGEGDLTFEHLYNAEGTSTDKKYGPKLTIYDSNTKTRGSFLGGQKTLETNVGPSTKVFDPKGCFS